MSTTQSFLLSLILLAIWGVACVPATSSEIRTPEVPGENGQTTDATAVFPIQKYESIVSNMEYSRQIIDTNILHTQPYSINGNEYVVVSFEDQALYLINWKTGGAQQISSEGVQVWDAVLSDKYIAWTTYEGDQSAKIDGRQENIPTHQIYVLYRESGQQKQITEIPALRTSLDLDGERLIWADKRNEMEEFYTHYDIYAYDLMSETEIPIAIAPGEQQMPKISGDTIVWQDNRNSPNLGMPLSGCNNCPENKMDLYTYDFQTDTSRPLVEDDWLKTMPDINDRQVSWVAYSEQNQGDIFLMDLDTRHIQQVTQTADPETSPLLTQDRLLWKVSSDCDVIAIDGETGQEISFAYGVYVFDFTQKQLDRITDFKEPRFLSDNDNVVVTEGCMTGFESYVITLMKSIR